MEGGFSVDENGLPFVVTYCITEDTNGKKSIGKSLGVRLNKEMFDYVKQGKSLNKVIEGICDVDSNKQNQGITGYLSNGLYKRSTIDKDAIISSFITFKYLERREELNKILKYERSK